MNVKERENEIEVDIEDEVFDDDENLVLSMDEKEKSDALNLTNWKFGNVSWSGSETSDDEKDFVRLGNKYKMWKYENWKHEKNAAKLDMKLKQSQRRLEATKENIAKLKEEILEEEEDDNNNKNKRKRRKRKKTMTDIEDGYNKWKKKQNKKGVIYIAKVPFGCNPKSLKKIFSDFGKVTNVHLESSKGKDGTEKKIHGIWSEYCEAWVEFADKKIAKEAARLLHDTKIPRRYVKSRRARSHIWNMKYLKGFGWHHLKEYKTQIRTLQRKKYEIQIADAHRQAAYFESQVKRAKQITQEIGNSNNMQYGEDQDRVYESSDDEAPPMKKQKVVEQRSARIRRNHSNHNLLNKLMK